MRHRLAFLTLILSLVGCDAPAPTPLENRPPLPSRIVDLSHTITEDLPVRLWGKKALTDRGFSLTTEFREVVSESPFYVANSYWTLMNHGGPHVDAPNHMGTPDGRSIDEYPLEAFVGRIRLMDLRSQPKDETVPVSVIQNYDIVPGDVVLALIGYEPPTGERELPSFAYLSKEAAEYLAGIPVKMFGTDAASVEGFKSAGEGLVPGSEQTFEAILPVHHAFLSREIPVLEQLANVEQLLGIKSAIFVGLPLKVHRGNGSPIRPAAFIY